MENMEKYGKYENARDNKENGNFGGISSKRLPPTSKKGFREQLFHIFPYFLTR